MTDDILAALNAERYDNRWWRTRPDVQADNERRRIEAQTEADLWRHAFEDDEMTTARRRRELLEACAEAERPERKAG